MNAVIGYFVNTLFNIDAMYLFCFTLGTRGRQLNTHTYKSASTKCFHDATCQLEHDGQVQPQESITGKERLILDMGARCIDEK